MQHLDEGMIHAWIDGELSPEQASEVEAHASTCPECAAMVAEARGLVAAATRILTALDDVPGGVIPSVPDIAPAQVVRRRWYQRTDLRAAAALLFVAGASLIVVRRGTDADSSRAMLETGDKGQTAQAVTAETTGMGSAEVAQKSIADAASESPKATAPTVAELPATKPSASRTGLRRAAATSTFAGPTGQSMQAKVMADARPSAIRARDETQRLKEETAKIRAANVGLDQKTTQLEGVVATSAAVAPAPATLLGAAVSKAAAAAPLRVVRADSTGATKQTVYEVSQGVEVTLSESPLGAVAERDMAANDPARQKVAAPQTAGAAPETNKRENAVSGRVAGGVFTPLSARAIPLNSISWTERGRLYVLSGRLTTKDLEALKARLVQMRR